jgi:hypothetical protein
MLHTTFDGINLSGFKSPIATVLSGAKEHLLNHGTIAKIMAPN